MGLREPFWNDTDCDFRATWANGLGQERSRMHSNWTGFDGIEQEDAVIAISMATTANPFPCPLRIAAPVFLVGSTLRTKDLRRR